MLELWLHIRGSYFNSFGITRAIHHRLIFLRVLNCSCLCYLEQCLMMHQSSHLATRLPRATTQEEEYTQVCTLLPASTAQKPPSPQTCSTQTTLMLCLMVLHLERKSTCS